MVAPNLVQQLGTAMDPFRMGHEKVQQAEFRGPQVQQPPVARDPVGYRVQAQPLHIHRILRHLGRPTAQHGLDPGLQLPGGKGFGNVVIGPRIQAGDFVLLVAPGREHDNGHIPGPVIAPQAAGQLEARHAGQHPVQQNHVRQDFPHPPFRLLRIQGPQNAVARMLEIGRNQLLNGRFVFHHKNVGCHG